MDNSFGRSRQSAYRGQHDFRISSTVQSQRTPSIAGTTSAYGQPHSLGSVCQRATLVVAPERTLTRDELLAEMHWAIDAIRDLSSRGGEQRLQRDPQFRYAMAFLWLRLGEPANQLVRRRLVSKRNANRWRYLCIMRHQLAHDRNQEIEYLLLWRQVEELLEGTANDVRSEL